MEINIDYFFVAIIGVIAVLVAMIIVPQTRQELFYHFLIFTSLFIGIILGKNSMKPVIAKLEATKSRKSTRKKKK